MRVGIDYRPVVAAPYSGIARQVLGMEEVIVDHDHLTLLRFSPCSAANTLKEKMCVPPWQSDDNGLHRPLQRLRFEFQFLPSAVQEQALDIYIATANQGLPMWRRGTKIKSILLLHDIFQLTLKEDGHQSKLKRMAYRCIDYISIRLSVTQADFIWVPSEYTKGEAIKHFPKVESKIRVLPNLVRPLTQTIDEKSMYGFPDKYWLLVGTSEPRKNIPWFIRAWKKMRANNVNIPDLVVVGSSMDVPEFLREEVGLYFKTEIDDETLSALYTYADLFWMPSYAEGFGLPVIEALSTGTPVAVANGSSLDDITPDSAWRFDPCETEALCQLMTRVSEQPSAEGDTKEKRKQWASNFAMRAYSKRLKELLEEAQK